SGYRTDLGLETPVPRIINDQAAGLSGFGSIIFNKTPADQLRLTTSVRGDHYQVPIDPAASEILHDVENERDDFVNFSWLHTATNGVLITVSPFYHFNRAHYSGSPKDAIRSEYDRGSNFIGGVTTLGVTRGRHNFHAGFQVFSERDNQREFGLTIPFKSWTFDIANFRTGVRNFFDHDVLGDSDVFFPLTIAHARIRGWEASVNSPNIASRAKFHLAYSHQYAQGAGAVTGGLTDFSPPEQGYFFLDHDQRDTLSTGFNLQLPWHASADFNTNYGSGFLDADGPAHLPSHTTFDLALGKSFGENWSVRLTALNFTNHRFMLDNSNTFGGTHFVNPREISA